MTEPTASTRVEPAEYRCPGEIGPISRAVHLGRMARFYPGCRQCPHCHHTGTLSARHVRRLAETRHRGRAAALFDDEGACGVYVNELGPAEARRMAVALGVWLRDAEGKPSDPSDPPVVAIAGDGRPQAPELVAAVSDGLRWAGCGVIDAGAATAPCLAAAVQQVGAAGGILVGNPAGRADTVGLKLWARGAEPLSAGPDLDAVGRLFHTPPDRPVRRFGPLRRWQAEVPYLAGLADHYHALRPLRLVLHTTCRPVADYLNKLIAPVACEVLPCPAPFDRLGPQVQEQSAHFGAAVGDDGETARVFDERGRPVAAERLLLLLARHLLADDSGGTVVLEPDTPPAVARRVRSLGGRAASAGLRRAEMHRAMGRHHALLGGGRAGRLWFRRVDGPAAPDALLALTLLLEILSQSDRPLSQVLDADAPAP